MLAAGRPSGHRICRSRREHRGSRLGGDRLDPRPSLTPRRAFWWLAVGYFCGLFSWYAVQVHQTKYLIEIGFGPSEAAWALGLVSLAAVPGQIAFGHLSDRIGRE
jgi:predicted MFS family arabinose efflux permease